MQPLFFLSKDQFDQLDSDVKRIVVTAKADICPSTVLSFEAFRENASHIAFLDSCDLNLETSRYSFLAIDSLLSIKAKGRVIWSIKNDITIRYTGEPLYFLNGFLTEKTYREELPFFTGGGVGYFAYEAFRYISDIPLTEKEPERLPDFSFFIPETVISFDSEEKAVYVSVTIETGEKDYDYAQQKITEVMEKLAGIEESTSSLNEGISVAGENDQTASSEGFQGGDYSFIESGEIRKYRTQEEFEDIVVRAKEYIADGDIYQINLSQRFEYETDEDPWEIYKRLRVINPSPFAGFLKFQDLSIISSSPERLISRHGDRLETRPIAGTRPRGTTEEADEAISRELLLNPKELAEHIMMIDLERNDIGKVSKKGTVNPEPSMFIENYSHVKHIVTNISGEAIPQADWIDVFTAMFPGGTITGCPKKHTMEIISELEEIRRGIYTGSFGWIGYNGDMDLNIIIRSFLHQNNLLSFYTGAGIVHDSVPENEYRETLKKAEALVKSIQKPLSP